MSRRDFKEGSCGREIIDEVVEQNKSKNMKVYEECKDMPKYMGSVNIGEPRIELKHHKKRADLGVITLIAPLTKGVEHFKMNPGDGQIVVNRKSGMVQNNAHPTVIKIVKVATALSINPNADYSACMVALVDELCENSDRPIILPLSLPKENKTQSVISEQINKWLFEIFDKDKVPYNTIVGEAKDEDEYNKLLNFAKAGAPDVH